MADKQPFISEEKPIETNETTQFDSTLLSLNEKLDNVDDDNEQYYNDILDQLANVNPNIDFFICKKCKKHPLLKFDNDFLYNLNEFFYTCDCQKNEYIKIKIEEFENLFGVGYFDENNDDLRNCIKCNNNHKFSGYLEINKKDICIKCMNVKDKNKIEEKYIKFDEHAMYKRIKYLISIFKLYEEVIVNNSDNNNNDEKSKREKQIKMFITELIRNYIKLKNYNVYQTLINLETSIQESEKKSSIDDLFKYNLEIKNANDFRKIINDKNLLEYVTKINITRRNINNLGLLSCIKNLNHLDLRNNCIVDIKPLVDASFLKLEFLNLSSNKIGNDSIPHLKHFKFTYLKYLNLDSNNISDYGIFFALSNNKNFKQLEQLYLKFNVFTCFTDDNGKKIKRKEYKEYFNKVNLDFNSIQKLGISYGVFNNISIEYIFPCLELNNIKVIDLSYNNLSKYGFLFTKDKCKWCRQLEKDIKNKEIPKVEKIILKKGNYKIDEILNNSYCKLDYAAQIQFLNSFIY